MGYDGDEMMVDAHRHRDISELKACLDSIMGEGFYDEYNEYYKYMAGQSNSDLTKVQLEYEKLIQAAETDEEKAKLEKEEERLIEEIREKEYWYEDKLEALEVAWKEKTGVDEIDDIWNN